MPKILLLDDDALFRHYLAALLERAGYDVHAYSNGSEALRLIEIEAFDAVITDIYMPYVDGIEIVCAVKRQSPGTPVIGISGGRIGSRDPCRTAMTVLGADAMLTKPIDAPALFAVLRRTVHSTAQSADEKNDHVDSAR
jgi:CheY-like chemotaxis protein